MMLGGVWGEERVQQYASVDVAIGAMKSAISIFFCIRCTVRMEKRDGLGIVWVYTRLEWLAMQLLGCHSHCQAIISHRLALLATWKGRP